MCGILWAIYTNKINTNTINNFEYSLKKIKSRWPDNTWIYQNKNLCLWHTRLSIIDTSDEANQPFQKDDYIIIFNWEIYNFKTIKASLQKKGYKFITTSDTEVVLYSYQERWERCVEYFDGMWAFAIYEKKWQKMFLSRDMIWEKPLLYYTDKNRFVFWSEINSILWLIESKDIKIYKRALSNFSVYNFKHIPSPYTPFQDIFKLDPWYSISINTKTLEYRKYKYSKIKKIKITDNPINQCDTILSDAVKQTCFADVPVGIFLSWWVDSSLIASMMKNRDITTYSLWYNKDDEELKRAKEISKKLGLKNKQFYFWEYFKNTNLLETLKKAIKHYWEPVNLMQIIYSDILLKEMKKDWIIVAVGWNAADELFYGYDWMNKLALISKIKTILDCIWLGRIISNTALKKRL